MMDAKERRNCDDLGDGRWRKLSRCERCAIFGMMLLVGVVGLVHLPPGACFGDAGDLQSACATLGIAHPPGYIGITAVGYLLCKVFFFAEPGFVVSVACLACIVASLGLIAALLVRMGLHIGAACAVVLLLVAHQSPWQSTVWQNMVYPEVYAPAWLLLIGTVYLLFRYGHSFRSRDLWLAGVLYGLLVMQRPPSVLFSPALLAGWLLIEHRRRAAIALTVKRGVQLLACSAASVALMLALLWVRDIPGAAYNGIEQYAEGYGTLPAQTDGIAARVQRVKWAVTGEQFRDYLKSDFSHARPKLRWVRSVLHLRGPGRLPVVFCILAAGTFVLSRRRGEWAVVAVGIIASNLVFVMLYSVYEQAANLLPTMFGAAMLGGAAISPLFPLNALRWRRHISTSLFLAMCVWTLYHATVRYNYGDSADASAYLAEVQLDALPPDAVVCAGFYYACPLLYDRLITSSRQDIHIIVSPLKNWVMVVERYLDRPIFYTEARGVPPSGWTLEPVRNLWRLVPITRMTESQ